jgi:hypothetical protein
MSSLPPARLQQAPHLFWIHHAMLTCSNQDTWKSYDLPSASLAHSPQTTGLPASEVSGIHLPFSVKILGHLIQSVSLHLSSIVRQDGDLFFLIPALKIPDVGGLRRHLLLAEMAVAFPNHMVDDQG